MLQNCRPRRNIRSFRLTAMFSTGPQGHNSQPARAKQNGTWSTLQLSSGISANILDFGMPQKHVLKDKMTIAARAVAGEPGYHRIRRPKSRARGSHRADSES